MPGITISVNDELAQAHGALSEEHRRLVDCLLEMWLRELLHRRGRPLDQLMDEIGAQATARGLTAESLEELRAGD